MSEKHWKIRVTDPQSEGCSSWLVVSQHRRECSLVTNRRYASKFESQSLAKAAMDEARMSLKGGASLEIEALIFEPGKHPIVDPWISAPKPSPAETEPKAKADAPKVETYWLLEVVRSDGNLSGTWIEDKAPGYFVQGIAHRATRYATRVDALQALVRFRDRNPTTFPNCIATEHADVPAPPKAEPKLVNPFAHEWAWQVFKECASLCTMNSRSKGFGEDEDALIAYLTEQAKAHDQAEGFVALVKRMRKSERIALIHSEVSELLEGVRKPGPSDHCPELSLEEEELADVVYRCFDYAGREGIDLCRALRLKFDFNASRPYKHGKKF